jgi:hypothetical protein
MARRRMFNLDIIDTDSFIEMPQSSRLLYYELCMRADDDGFVSSPKKIQRVVGCSDDDFKVLITKRFIIPFETGIVVIRHWKIHNYIQKDRYKETLYSDEKSLLTQEENGTYKLMDTSCIQNGDTGKVSIELDKYNKRENIYKREKELPDTPPEDNKKEKKEPYGKYGRVKLKISEYLRLREEFGEEFIQKQIELLDEYLEMNNNKNKYTNFNLVLRKSIRENWFKDKKQVQKGNNVFLDIMEEDYESIGKDN